MDIKVGSIWRGMYDQNLIIKVVEVTSTFVRIEYIQASSFYYTYRGDLRKGGEYYLEGFPTCFEPIYTVEGFEV